jgi:hypothetical protein
MAIASSYRCWLASVTASSSLARVLSRMSPVIWSPAPLRPADWATITPASRAKAPTAATTRTSRRHERDGRAAATRAWCDSMARIVRAARAV